MTCRGEIGGLYRVLMNDDGPVAAELMSYPKKALARLPFRIALARALLQAARDPRRAMIVLEQIADRLEGKAIQKLRHEVPHANYFYKAGGRSHPRSRPRSERYSMV